MYTAALIGSRRDNTVKRDNSEERAKAGPEKNDYIRTAVVTSANDKYLIEFPNLCLICGSIGKETEGKNEGRNNGGCCFCFQFHYY